MEELGRCTTCYGRRWRHKDGTVVCSGCNRTTDANGKVLRAGAATENVVALMALHQKTLQEKKQQSVELEAHKTLLAQANQTIAANISGTQRLQKVINEKCAVIEEIRKELQKTDKKDVVAKCEMGNCRLSRSMGVNCPMCQTDVSELGEGEHECSACGTKLLLSIHPIDGGLFVKTILEKK